MSQKIIINPQLQEILQKNCILKNSFNFSNKLERSRYNFPKANKLQFFRVLTPKYQDEIHAIGPDNWALDQTKIEEVCGDFIQLNGVGKRRERQQPKRVTPE